MSKTSRRGIAAPGIKFASRPSDIRLNAKDEASGLTGRNPCASVQPSRRPSSTASSPVLGHRKYLGHKRSLDDLIVLGNAHHTLDLVLRGTCRVKSFAFYAAVRCEA